MALAAAPGVRVARADRRDERAAAVEFPYLPIAEAKSKVCDAEPTQITP